MKRKSKERSLPGVFAGRFFSIAGLVACFTVSSVFSTSLAQPVIRRPGARPPEGASQQRAAEITSLMVSYLPNNANSRLSDMGSTTLRRGSWMRVLIQFTTEPAWIDEIRFDCYVLMRSGNERTLLTGSVTCLYVQAGRRHLAAIFVPPNVLERYGRRVEAVAVECSYQNSEISDYSVPRTSRKWWQDYTGVPDTMVTWFYTPFLRNGAEAYEQVKTGRQGF